MQNVRRETDPGPGWFNPSEYIDAEVNQAFHDGRARLYLRDTNAWSKPVQYIIITTTKEHANANAPSRSP